jgi:hypothetical protein
VGGGGGERPGKGSSGAHVLMVGNGGGARGLTDSERGGGMELSCASFFLK